LAARLAGAGLAVIFFASCEQGDGKLGDGFDFGNNNPDLYLAMGDSITLGGYPGVLASKLGKPVINAGVGGAMSEDGASRVSSLLASHKPGFLLIDYGANDCIHGRDQSATIENLRHMINAARGNQTIPVIATLTPMYGSHGVFDGGAHSLSQRIREMAASEDVPVADMEKAFGDDQTLIQSDGLHPNAAGNEVMAQTFFNVLN
jgi:lysophospholipase L1-like esterase